MTPAELVGLLKPTTPDLSARIGSIPKIWNGPTGKISGRFHYVTFRDGKPVIDDLIQVAHARMVNFIIPRSRINEVLAEAGSDAAAGDAWVLLTTEARDLFIRTKNETGRSGELGELLLYMLLEWVLKAPIVACKMYLKTAQQMPVHGTDGIHMGYENDNLIVYWGESKLHTKMGSALADIVASVSKQLGTPSKRANEVRIIRANMNLDGFDAGAKEAIKNYFNPYKPESNKLWDCHACLAGFDSKFYDEVGQHSADQCEAAFRGKYEASLPSTNVRMYTGKPHLFYIGRPAVWSWMPHIRSKESSAFINCDCVTADCNT
jgi:hypothetical protein